MNPESSIIICDLQHARTIIVNQKPHLYGVARVARRSAAGLTSLPLLYPDAVQQDYIPTLFYSAGRVGPSAAYYLTGYMPFVNENTTYCVVAGLVTVNKSLVAES